MSSCGAASISELQKTARLTVVSSTSIIEGGAHDVILKDKDINCRFLACASHGF